MIICPSDISLRLSFMVICPSDDICATHVINCCSELIATMNDTK